MKPIHQRSDCWLTLQNQQLKKMRHKLGELDRLLASLRITPKADTMALKDISGHPINFWTSKISPMPEATGDSKAKDESC